MTSTSLAGVVVVVGLLGTAASAQAPATPAVYQPGNGVVSPRLVHEVKPGYPPAAMRAGISGVVKMECVVLADGTVGDVQVTQSLAPELDAEAIKSLKMWRFSPGTKDGAPVAVQRRDRNVLHDRPRSATRLAQRVQAGCRHRLATRAQACDSAVPGGRARRRRHRGRQAGLRGPRGWDRRRRVDHPRADRIDRRGSGPHPSPVDVHARAKRTARRCRSRSRSR